MDDLDAASLEDVAAFFSMYYTPDNAVLTIAGDFEPAAARAFVERHFGSIPRGRGKPSLPDMSLPPRFGGWQREVVEDDVVLPRLFLAFRSPAMGTPDYYAASVCAAVLGAGKGSRMHRTLVREQQVASDATAFTYDLTKGADVLVLDVTALPGTTPDALETAVAALVDDVHENGVSGAEVARAAALIETELVTSLQSAGDRADRLSMFTTYFDEPELVNVQPDLYRGVTAADVTRFARERLGADNRVSLLYVPRAARTGAPLEAAEAHA